MNYCKYCGKELGETERCSCSETQQNRAKRMKLCKWLICIAAFVIVVAIIIAVLVASAKTDPFDYISVSFEGYNTNGNVDVDMDAEALIAGIIGAEPDEENLTKFVEWYALYEEHADNIHVEYFPQTELSNGDIVTVTITVSGKTAKSVKSASKEYTVSGLVEIETVDVFANIDVIIEGVNGSGWARVSLKNKDDEFMNALSFVVGGDVKNGQLSNGDTVTITAKYSDTLIEKHQKMPKTNSVTLTVSGLSRYATKDDIPAATIAPIAQQFIAEKEAALEPTSMFTYSPVELYGVYYAEAEEGKFSFHENELHILIVYTQYMYGEYHSTIYLPLYFENVLIDTDGNINIDYEDGQRSAFFYTDAEKYINDLSEDYKVTKIQ